MNTYTLFINILHTNIVFNKYDSVNCPRPRGEAPLVPPLRLTIVIY